LVWLGLPTGSAALPFSIDVAAQKLCVRELTQHARLLVNRCYTPLLSEIALFSPDGTRIVTTSFDGTARIWDAATGTEIKVLRGNEGSVWSGSFSPDGTPIVTASEDTTARIWDARFATIPTKALLVETCARWLVGISELSRDEMRLAGYSDDQPEIDVCKGVK
jgi:WD40 repeat protein